MTLRHRRAAFIVRYLHDRQLRAVDPHRRGWRRRLGRLPHEPFGVCRVRRRQEGPPPLQHRRGAPVVEDLGGQQPEPVVPMLRVVPVEEPRQKPRASWTGPKRSGNVGGYLRVLTWASE